MDDGLVPHTGKLRNIYRILVGKPDGKRLLGTQALIGR
jgi:hypothetical protein